MSEDAMPAKAAPRWRKIASTTAIVLGAVLLVAGNFAVWLQRTALDTEEFVDVTSDVVRREAVADAISVAVVDRLFEEVDVEEIARDVLPDRAEVLAAPISGAVRAYTQDAVHAVLTSDEFQRFWSDSVAFAHRSALRVVTGGGDLAQAVRGQVVLDLDALVEQALERLEDRGVTLFEDGAPVELGTFVLFEGDQVEVVQKPVDLLDALGNWLPIVTLVVFAGAIALAADRRRAAAVAGMTGAAAMAVTFVVLRLTRRTVLGGIEIDQRREAADEIWDVLIDGLARQTAAVLAFGLVVAGIAWVVGPSPRAASVRDATRARLGTLRDERVEGRAPEGLTAFAQAHRRGLETGILVVAFVVLWVLPEVSLATVIVVAVLALVAVLVVELFGGGRAAASADEHAQR